MGTRRSAFWEEEGRRGKRNKRADVRGRRGSTEEGTNNGDHKVGARRKENIGDEKRPVGKKRTGGEEAGGEEKGKHRG